MFNLTTYAAVDRKHLNEMGYIREDTTWKSFYKFFCEVEYGNIMWQPQKFRSETNYKIPYTKVDVNPKYFNNYNMFQSWLFGLFCESEDISLNSFNVSRIDLKSDIENLFIDAVLPRLYAMGYRRDSVGLYKGTIYIGSNPKIRIYDKIKEIKARARKGGDVTDCELEMLSSGKQITRFEIQIRGYKGTLKDVVNNPVGLASYFDKLQFYDMKDDEKIASMGGLQRLMSRIPRKYRVEYETFRNEEIQAQIRNNYISSVKEWFEGDDGRDGVPF